MTSLLLLIKTDSDPTAGIISSRQHIKGNGTKQPRQQSSQPILTCHSLMHVSTLPMFRDLLVFNCSSRTTYTVKLQIAECKDSFPSNTPQNFQFLLHSFDHQVSQNQNVIRQRLIFFNFHHLDINQAQVQFLQSRCI